MLANRNRVIDYIRLLSKYDPLLEVYTPYSSGVPDTYVPAIVVNSNGSLTLTGQWRAENPEVCLDVFEVTVMMPIMPSQNIPWHDDYLNHRAKCLEWLTGMGLKIDEDYSVEVDKSKGTMLYQFRDHHSGSLFKLIFG